MAHGSPPIRLPVVVPLFPLPNLVLFPRGSLLPLHIFEEGVNKRMVADFVKEPSRDRDGAAAARVEFRNHQSCSRDRTCGLPSGQFSPTHYFPTADIIFCSKAVYALSCERNPGSIYRKAELDRSPGPG